MEGKVDIDALFGGRFEMRQAERLCKRSALVARHGPLRLQIALVAHQDHGKRIPTEKEREREEGEREKREKGVR